MKKLLTVLLAATMSLSLCACGEGDAEESSAAQESVSAAASEDAAGNAEGNESTGEAVQPSAEGGEASTDAQPVEQSEDEPADMVDKSWFDDAIFVGDSVTLKLSYYAENGALGDAAFLCAGSLSYYNALWDIDEENNVHPTLNGTKYTVDEGVAASGKKNVFIMLGMNDIGLNGVDDSIENMKELIERILNKSPEVEIYIQSVTPMLENMQGDMLNNTTIPQFNEKLQEVCEERGFVYLDVASAVSDEAGNLVPEYCGDPEAMGIHFTDAGCKRWVQYLRSHVE